MAAAVNTNGRGGEPISSPPRWNQIVRGGDPQPHPVSVDPEVDASSKKPAPAPAWKNPYNAAVDTVVMGAVSWPTLSQSTLKGPTLSEPPQQLVATTTNANADANANATAVSPAPPQKQQQQQQQKTSSSDPNSPNPSAAQHHGRTVRHKSIKRDPGPNSSSNGTTNNNNTPLKASSDAHHNNNNVARDGGGQTSGHQRNFRRSSSGPHLRGDASFGGRRDQDLDWNRRRSFNGRDPYAPPHRVGATAFIRPPPPPPAAYVPPPMQPYGAPMSIPPEMQPLYYFAPHPGMPFVAQMPPAVYYPGPDPHLHVKITDQIDYYFSNENLVKDTYLRQNMDEQGWVPVQLIANFKKLLSQVMQLTTDIQLLLDAIRASTAVEIQGDKIRRRDDWKRWIMPPLVKFPSAAGSQFPRNLQDTLPARVQGLSLDENTAKYSNSNGQDFHAGILLRSSSGDMNGRPENSKEGRSSSGY